MEQDKKRQIYKFEPDQQELDWEIYVQHWPELYVGISFTLFLGVIIYQQFEGYTVLLFSIYALMAGIYVVLPVLGYLNRALAHYKITNTIDLRFEKGPSNIQFYQGDENFLSTPVDNIKEVRKVMKENGSMLSHEAGFGFEFHKLEEVEGEEEYLDQLRETHEERDIHYWLDSQYVGTQEQNEGFEAWIESCGLGRKLKEIAIDETLDRDDMTREDWMMVVFATLMLVLGLGAWIQILV